MRSKTPPVTATQANLLLVEVGIVAASALITLTGALRSLLKVKKAAEDVRDVAEEAVSKVL
jgi:hypothetical protein